MEMFSAYNAKTQSFTSIKNSQVLTMKDGRKAIKGIAADDGKTTVSRIISRKDAAKLNIAE
jgi:hypothetical protein